MIAFLDGIRFAHVLTLLGLTIEAGTLLMVDVRFGINPNLAIPWSTGIASRGLGLVCRSRRRGRAGMVEETKHALGGW